MDKAIFEKIDEYLNGEMSHEEQLAFEAKVTANKELAAYLNIYRSIEKEMHDYANIDEDEALFRNSLEKLTPQYFNIPEDHAVTQTKNFFSQYPISPTSRGKNAGASKKIKLWKTLAAAAAIIGIIILSVFFLLKNTNKNAVAVNNKKADTAKSIVKQDTAPLQQNIPRGNRVEKDTAKTKEIENQNKLPLNGTNPNALYATNFKPDALPDEIPAALEKPLAYYETGDYTNAIKAFKNASPELAIRGEEADRKINKFYISYYTSLSYMANGSASKAIPELKNAIAGSPDSSYYIKALWYLSLAYLKTDNTTKAKELLQQIAINKTESKFNQMSLHLLKELK